MAYIAGQPSPTKVLQSTPVKMEHSGELKDDLVKFYKTTGLESIAKEVNFITWIVDIVNPFSFQIHALGFQLLPKMKELGTKCRHLKGKG